MAHDPTGKSPAAFPTPKRTLEIVHCPNCQNRIKPPVFIEDRWGTRFCSVSCCDYYHEWAAVE